MHILRKGRAASRVGSDFLSAIAVRVGSGQRFGGSGRVQEKWPVDNSDIQSLDIALEYCFIMCHYYYITRSFARSFMFFIIVRKERVLRLSLFLFLTFAAFCTTKWIVWETFVPKNST